MPIITVSQLNNYMKRFVESNKNLSGIYVKGEISNYKRHSSGHAYMTLKDSASALKCVMFSSYVSRLNFEPRSGMKAIVFGKISVYERDGAYQLYAEMIVPDGIGELYAAYEQLKAQLETEGYFASELKKPLPKYPSHIGVVTSPQGSAVRDIISVLSRRYPLAGVTVYPALVQGVGAVQSIVAGIEYFNYSVVPDVIIVGRGGGSIEDLWAFNDRSVADAIYKSAVPVISAVGHETDFTIADFVADLRAPTPSAAAELAVPDIAELKVSLRHSEDKIKSALLNLVRIKRERFARVMCVDIRSIVLGKIGDYKITTDTALSDILRAYSDYTEKKKNALVTLCSALDALSPMKVLLRGYSVASNAGGVIKSVESIKQGDSFTLTLSDGSVECTALKKSERRKVNV